MIVPNGLTGLDDAQTIRNRLIERFGLNWFSGYAIRPAKLFDGVDQRLCIFIGISSHQKLTYVAGYRHWNAEERESLFSTIKYLPHGPNQRMGRLPQLSDNIGLTVLDAVESRSKKTVKSFYVRLNAHLIHYHRSPRYWIRAMDFEPHFKSATRDRSVHHFRDLAVDSAESAATICCLINSSLFFFWFVTLGNGRNVTGRDVEEFPLGSADKVGLEAIALNAYLMKSYKDNSFIRTRTDCEFQEFRPALSKSLIDNVDTLFAKHFGFSDLQLDYIINYDIKYRMGQGIEDNDD